MKAEHRHDYVLVVDDDASICRLIEFQLEQAGIPCKTCGTGAEAIQAIEESAPTAAVLDLMLPDANGQDLLGRFLERQPDLAIVVVTGTDEISAAVDCMKSGACDFLQKPFNHPRLLASVKNAHERGLLSRRLREAKSSDGLQSIIGESTVIEESKQMLLKAAGSNVTVLVNGPSGTGKELFARALHDESERHLGPFVAVNCGAIPESLIESELFGHAKGAFSGAERNKVGLFEQADGGTIFLDEIGELGLDLQVRLLRVLNDCRVRPVGSDTERKIDVRVVAATNRDLASEVGESRFREDLYYRISVFPIQLPSLAERNGDRALLARYFLERATQRLGRPFTMHPEALAAIEAYGWPGNVRQLENAIERAVVLAPGQEILRAHLPVELSGENVPPITPSRPSPFQQATEDPAKIEPLAVETRRILERALSLTGWNVQEAARRLGIGRATLYRKIQEFDLRRPQASDGLTGEVVR